MNYEEAIAKKKEQQVKEKFDLKSFSIGKIILIWFIIPFFLYFIFGFCGIFVDLDRYERILSTAILSIISIYYILLIFKNTGIEKEAIIGKFPPLKEVFLYASIFIPIKIFIAALLIEYTPYLNYSSIDPLMNVNLVDSPFTKALGTIGFILLTPIFEELFVRGIIFNKLIERYSLKKAIIGVGFLFAMLHGFEKGALFIVSGSAFIYGFLYYKTRSLYAPIIYHIINNFISHYLYLIDSVISYDLILNISKIGLVILYPIGIYIYYKLFKNVEDDNESIFTKNKLEKYHS